MVSQNGIGSLWDGRQKILGPATTLKLVSVGRIDESPVLDTLEVVKLGHAGDVLVIDHDGSLDVNSYGGVARISPQTKHESCSCFRPVENFPQ